MKIAIPYQNEKIFQHFGHTEAFKLYEIADKSVVSACVKSTNGQGHGALSAALKKEGVDVLICGGIGGGAKQALEEYGIRLYGGVQGACDEAVKAFLNGTLAYNENVRCEHHDHEHGSHDHTCGSHGCGKHNCHHGH